MIEKPSRHTLRNTYKSTTGQNWLLLSSSFIPFFFMWFLAYQALNIHYGLMILCALLAAGFLVRIFIIQHDCGHSALFNKRQYNDWLGRFCSVLTIVPYDEWKRFHNIHHATSGNLDKRGPGNVNTLTVTEFDALSSRQQLLYKVYRNPYFLFVVAPILLFFILKRFPLDAPKNWIVERRGTWLTSVAIGLALLLCGAMLGYTAVLQVHIAVLVFTCWAGTWIFYVQHQYEEAYWAHNKQWTFDDAAMIGSSYYQLPMVLRWFTNNICIHHVHHYQPRIPSHNINRCFNDEAYFRQVKPLTLWQSAKNMNLALWDEKQKKLIRFKEVKTEAKAETRTETRTGPKTADCTDSYSQNNEQGYEQG